MGRGRNPRDALPRSTIFEVRRIPKFGVYKLGWMEVRADDAASVIRQVFDGGGKRFVDFDVLLLIRQIGANQIPSHVVNAQQPAIPVGLIV